jgi:hypothetical protein
VKFNLLVRNLLLVCAVLLAASCGGSVNAVLQGDGGASLSVEALLIPALAPVLNDGGPLDVAALNNAIRKSPGVQASSLAKSQGSIIKGPVAVADLNAFLRGSLATGAPEFVRYDPDGSLTMTLSRATAQVFLTLLTADMQDYLSVLMAPAFTGDNLTKSENLSLLGSFNKTIVPQIQAASVAVTVTAPSPIRSIKGGKATGTKATFTIPLVDLLVLENPVEWNISW